MTRKKGNGEGSIGIYKNGRLRGQYTTQNGERKQIYQRKNESNKDFKKRFIQLLNEINQGTYIEKNYTTYFEILTDYIEGKFNTNKVKARTYSRDKQTLKQIEKCCKDIINIPIQKITVEHIKKILPNMTVYSNSTIDKIYRLFNKPFEIALSERIIMYNPMNNITISKPKSDKKDKKQEALNKKEMKNLVEILEKETSSHSDVLLIQLYTGMRIGEVLALRIDDIDFKDNIININKTITTDENGKTIIGDTTKTYAGTRKILMDTPVKDILEKIRKKIITNIKGFLFYDNSRNKFIAPSTVNSYLKRINSKYNIADNLHTHTLRHTFTTRCIESGMQPNVLQKILGHKDIKVTLGVYTSVTKEFHKKEFEEYQKYLRAEGI